MTPLPIGKLPSDLLESLLTRYASHDERVVLGPGVGEDAAVIDMGERYLVAKTDPITFATEDIGWYAVNVNANDVACCGATPRWFLATVLLPEGCTAQRVETIFDQIATACGELDIALCGGHTEITYGLERPIVVGQMLGEVAPGKMITTGGAKPGDDLILTKGIALEGTAIIASERAPALAQVMTPEEVGACAELLRSPGISVVRDAQIVLDAGEIHALHDPTEGGLATGLHELAHASGTGVSIDLDALPVLPACEKICRHLQLDPLGLIASGALLIAAAPNSTDSILRALQRSGLEGVRFGTVVKASAGRVMSGASGGVRPLPVFERDEITRLFE